MATTSSCIACDKVLALLVPFHIVYIIEPTLSRWLRHIGLEISSALSAILYSLPLIW
jgi:hypothetical protein